MDTAGKEARLLVLIAVVKGIVFNICFPALRRILRRPITPPTPLTFKTFLEILKEMSQSIQSATKTECSIVSGSLLCRKINVDLVLDRMSTFGYFGIKKGRLRSDQNINYF